MPALFYWIKTYGYLGVFASLMLGMFGLPLPDETILTFTGFLVFKNYLQAPPAVLAAFVGSACGITLNYLVGRCIGFPLLQRYGSHIHLSQAKLAQARRWFEKYGKFALFIGYFLPGIRHLTAFTAGSSRLPYWLFAPFAYAGGFCWVAVFIGLGYYVGEEWTRIMPQVQAYLWKAAAAVAWLVLVAYLVYRVRHLDRKRGRDK